MADAPAPAPRGAVARVVGGGAEEGVPPAPPGRKPGGLEPEPELERVKQLRELRAELAGEKKLRILKKRARDIGVDADEVDEAADPEESADPRAAVIELIVSAYASAELAAATENIKQRLDKGSEWKASQAPLSNWWQTDMANQVNRLRAAARVRNSLPDSTRDEIPDLYPQLVVLGDGNTGKSSVLNRFAAFAFSAVTDGVCTRRPVRLQLRPVRAENRKRMQVEKLLAICTMEDLQDQHQQEFTMRVQEREEDEHSLRLSVEKRASKAALQDGTAAAFDSQYIMEELVITIEADQMIYFDLLDLPGLDNSSPMPKKMVCKYINAGTLPRTFVLIFAEHKKGDTQLMHSLAFAELARVNEEVGDPGLWKQFITQRCLGVLTKVDKELESNTAKTPTEYDKDAATKLRSSLNCTDHPPHLDKWPWVAVLNPNKEEQEQNMSFEEACKKEKWFFDTLFPPGLEEDEATRRMCGIGNFRSKLVDRYEKFVAKQIKLAAPKVFAKVVDCGKHMSEAWAWEAEQECYENKEKMLQVLTEMINEMATIGKDSSEPTSVMDILLRDDVQQCIQRCRERVDPSTALEQSKLDLMKMMATVSAKLIEQVHCASQQLKYKRFVTLGKHMVKVMVFVSRQFFVVAERQLNAVIATEEKRYQHIPCHTRPIHEMINSLVSCAKSELSRLAQLIEDFPTLSPRYMVVDPPAFLEHTRPKIAELKPPFGFVCSSDGLVNSVVDADRCAIPKGSTVLQIDGRDFTQSAMLESANQPRPVRFAYSTPGCGVVPDGLEITKWMYHRQHVSRVYLEERERFLCHRRAAEILVLLFDEETAGGAERAAFEGMQGGKQLVLLESAPGDEPDWYERNYHGERPNLPPDAAANGSMSLSFQIELPGTCCTKGCARTHDTAFNPCGHTVCCWECATLLDTCPVCGIDLMCTTGTAELPFHFREPKDLCYDHPPTEADHQHRVKLATQHDSDTRQATKDEYGQMLVVFADPQEVSPDAAWEALERHRQALLRKPDRLEGQMRLWPTFADLMEQKQNFETRLREQKQQAALELAQEKQRAADELAAEKQRAADELTDAAFELAQEKQRAADELAAARATAARQGHEEMLDYAKELEGILRGADCRRKKSCWDDSDTCQTAGCNAAFGSVNMFTTYGKYNCAGCGQALCKACCAATYPFDTANTNAKSGVRVCGPCQAALAESRGTRTRLVPARRPDGSDFGS